MDLYQLETFLAVAQEKSFSRAAQRLHRTQSAISQTISKLEDNIGEVLFDRSSRDGTLTDAGRLLEQYAEELLNLRTEARDALAELRQLHQGKLVIAANEFTSLYILPVIHEFHRLHPTVRIQVQRSLASEVPRQIVNHNVEFGILSFPPEDEQLTSVVFCRDELAFVVYPTHPLASAKKVSVKDLGTEQFVAHIVLSPFRLKVIQAFKNSNTPLTMNVELPTMESIKQFVQLGNGVAIVPRVSVENEIRRGELVAVPVTDLKLERKLRIVYRKGSTMSHAGRAFLKVCEALAASNPNYLFQPEGKVRKQSASNAGK